MDRFMDAIRAAQKGDEKQLLFLIEQFTPLLRKYARRLHTEDAENELTLRLIEIITGFDTGTMKNQSDGAIVNYFCAAVYHTYCKLQAKRQEYRMIDIDDPAVQRFLMALPESRSPDKLPDFPDGLLTDTEHTVIKQLFERGRSSTEIAQELHISRQGVNQTKLRAMKKLRKYYVEPP